MRKVKACYGNYQRDVSQERFSFRLGTVKIMGLGKPGWEEVADYALNWAKQAISSREPAGVG